MSQKAREREIMRQRSSLNDPTAKVRKADFERAMQALFANMNIKLETYRGRNRYEYERITRSSESQK